MIKLAEPVYFLMFKQTLVATTILFCVVVAITLLLRKRFRRNLLKFKFLLGFVCIYIFLWIVVFGGYTSFYKIRADMQFRSFIEIMNSCNSIQVSYPYYSSEREKFEHKETSITDIQTIKELIQVIDGNSYKWIHLQSRPMTNDYVEYKVFKNDEEVFNFSTINTNILRLSSNNRSYMYWSSDLEFYSKINHLLGIVPGGVR